MRRAERIWRLGVGIALILSFGLSVFGCSDREEESYEPVGRMVLVTPDTSTVFHREPSLNRDGTTVIFSTDWPFDPAIDDEKDARDIAVINLPEGLDGYPITGSPDTIQAAQFRKVLFGLMSSESPGGVVQFDPNLKGKSAPAWNPSVSNEFALVIQNANFLDRVYVCTVDLSQADGVPVTDHKFLPAPPPPDSRALVGWNFNSPSYSPDGRWLLFSRYFEAEIIDEVSGETIVIYEPQALWVYDLNSDQEYRLTSGTSREGEGAWSPNGNSIVFATNRRADLGAGRDIFLIDFDASNPGQYVDYKFRQLTHSNNDEPGPSFLPIESFDPVWSPNGREISFVSTRRAPGVSLRDRSLWIMGTDGSDQRALVFTRYDDVNPDYDPGASGRLVFSSGDHPLPVWKGQRSDIWLLRDF